MEVPYTNEKDHAVSIAGKRIGPGETRSVEETMIPGYRRPAAPEKPRDPVMELLDNPVKDVVTKLPELSDDDFNAVWQAEIDGKTRKSLIAAFEEEQLRRAEEQAKAEGSGKGGQGEGSGEGGQGEDSGEDGE